MMAYTILFRVQLLLVVALITESITVFSQPPVITYGGYKLFIKDSAIIPLSPVNNGGKVPQAIYSQTITFAGTDQPGAIDAMGTKAGFNRPVKIAIDRNNNLYVADELNDKIRKISPDGMVSTLAGSGKAGAENNTKGTMASFNGPCGVAVDKYGNVYVADAFNHKIRKITPNGVVSNFAGNGQPGYVDDVKGLSAAFNFPVDLAVDEAGNLFVVDEGNNKIRKITPSGTVTTFAGTGSVGSFDNSIGVLATFNQPNGIAIDGKGNIYIADQLNHKIRKITNAGAVSTLAGTGFAGSADHNIGTLASFNNPRGIAVDPAGYVFVGDVGNQKIRKISPSGAVTTLAGSGAAGSQDNTNGLLAGFYFPGGIVTDSLGNVFVADCLNNKIRKIDNKGYFISPELLPQGLEFNYTTGIFSGTPVEDVINSTYTITAYNQFGSSTTKLGIGVSSEPGNALHFDGFDDRVNIPDADHLHTPVVTVELWANIKNLQAGFARMIVKRNSLPGYDDSYSLGVDSNFKFRAAICSGSGKAEGQRFATQKDNLEPGKWYFVAGVFRPDSVKLYVNGVLQESIATGFPLSYSKNAMVLGFDDRLSFAMDELRIFNADRSDFIIADKNNALSPSAPGLVAYYNFNSGRPGGSNPDQNILVDLTTHANHGVLTNFQPLSGNISNWVESYAKIVPFAMEAVDIQEKGFTAAWKKPSVGELDHYLLDVADKPDFSSFVAGYHNLIVTGTTHLVTGLKKNTTYYYRITAEKQTLRGQGGYSNTVSIKTNQY